MTHEFKNLLEKASVSLLLDSYDAIFSDFDPRPYGERTISDDFLIEAKKAVRETTEGSLELHFLIPKHLHNPHEDQVIRERLHRHFKKHAVLWEAKIKRLTRHGILLVIGGMILMFLASLVTHFSSDHFGFDLLQVIFEPAGWFTVWFGLDQIFYLTREQHPELEFYLKMTHAEIHFDTY